MSSRRTSLCLLTPHQLFALKMRILEGDEVASAEFYDATNGCAYALALQILRKTKPAEDVVFRAYSHLWRDPAELRIQRDLFSELVLLVRKLALEKLRRRRLWRNLWIHPMSSMAQWLGSRLKRRVILPRVVILR